MIGSTVAHYQIEEKLGGGGMGVVYRALDTKLDRSVALKFLPPSMSHDKEAKARFVQEAKAASGLDHANVCTIYEIGEADDGRLYIAMGYYEGRTVKHALADGPRPEEEVASIGVQIAEGLAAAHEAGIVHRDIKPANLMLLRDGRVKILDFGVAKLGHGADLTAAGSTVGTTAYMSPEQAQGREVDGRTDLWSLGVVLYELLTGRRPFEGTYDQAVLYSILNQEPESPGGELAGIVTKMLAKDPAERYQTAAEVAGALRPFSSGVHSVVSANASRENGQAASAATLMPPRWAIPVVAVLLAGLLWLLFERGGEGPEADGVEPNRVMILPFRVQGPAEMDPLSDGMVTLLSTMLDGAGQITTVDQVAVIEAIQRRGETIIGPGLGAELARDFRAGRFVVGSIVRAGSENRMSAGLYRLDGTRESEARAVYTGDNDFIGAVDVLAGQLVGGRLIGPSQELSSLAVGTTSSFEALKHYFESDRLLRAGEFSLAEQEIDQALAIDSTFAIAWYLKSEIRGWRGSPRRAINPLRRAVAHSEGLTGQAARIIQAELAFQEGRWRDAERMQRAILRDYPESKEATSSLGEILEHYQSTRKAKLDALRMWERVTELSPGNVQFAMHHSDMLAMKGSIEGDYYGLDSLAAVYAGLPIPARGDSLDWSLALTQMTPDARRYMAMHARLAGSSEDSVASYDLLADVAFDAGRFINSFNFDLALAAYRASSDWSPDNFDWLLLRAGGRWAEAEKAPSVPRTEYSALLATLPTHAIGLDSLAGLRRAIEAMGPEDLVGSQTERWRLYLLGLLSWRMDDAAALRLYRNALEALGPDAGSSRFGRALGYELAGLSQWMEGDLEAAEESMMAALPDSVYFLDLSGSANGRRQPFWYLAEIREARGDLEGAIEYFDTIHLIAAVPGLERTANLHERLGNTDQAIRYYRLITEVWKNADPQLQPRVEAARARMEALLQSRTREGS